MIVKESGGAYICAANIPDCWNTPGDTRPTHRSIFGEEIGRLVEHGSAEATKERKLVKLDVSEPRDGRKFEFVFEPVALDNQQYMLIIIVEMTEERRREQRLLALLREVNHRTKNLLAIVHSIAAQTARSTGSLSSFLQRFNGRIYSLSRSQDLVIDTSWKGALFADLVKAQAGKYLNQSGEPFDVTGENPMLNPNETLYIGLAVHELFVDAVALTERGDVTPQITVECRRNEFAGKDGLEVRWIQKNKLTNGQVAARTERDTFGSSVLTRIAPAAVDGEAEFIDDGAKVIYALRFAHQDAR
ncbi:MAG: hypothetical protein Rhirs2KO_09960 [Rhizobiaceae bacterium]